jgi:O-antigen/teichoic acid export membrane protein
MTGSLTIAPSDVAAPVPARAYRSALLLGLSTIASAAAGFVFWIVAARLFPPSVVGAESGALTLVMLVAVIAQLDLHVGFPRFLPMAGRQRARLIRSGYAAAVLAAVAAAGVIWLVTRSRVIDLLPGLSPATTAVTLLALPIWVLFSLQDSVLIGLRAASWFTVENLSYNLVKVGLLWCTAAVLPEGGIVTAAILPALLAIPLVNALIFRRLLPVAPDADEPAKVTRRTVQRFLINDYPGGICTVVATRALPLIVIAQLGATAGGYFFIAWQIVLVLEQALASLGVTLTVEAATSSSADATRMAQKMLKRVLLPVIGFTVLAVLLAQPVLRLFGAGYAEHSASVLIALLLGLPLRPVIDAALAVMRLHNKTALVSSVQFARAPLGIAAAVWLTAQHGIVGAAWSYVATSGVLAVVCCGYLLRRSQPLRRLALPHRRKDDG